VSNCTRGNLKIYTRLSEPVTQFTNKADQPGYLTAWRLSYHLTISPDSNVQLLQQALHRLGRAIQTLQLLTPILFSQLNLIHDIPPLLGDFGVKARLYPRKAI
jgi:hypothetical protein